MNTWVPILYRDFWDVPRLFAARHRQRLFLFDCPFDPEAEDYGDAYDVFLLPEDTPLDPAGSWADLRGRAVAEVGHTTVSRVPFDPTRRQAVDAAFLDSLLRDPHDADTPGGRIPGDAAPVAPAAESPRR